MKLNHTNLAAVLALLFILCAFPSFGQESINEKLSYISSLPELALWLEKNPPETVPLSGTTGQQILTQTLTTLRQDVERLRYYLRSNGVIGAKWESVLFLDELRTTINQASPDMETLQRIYERFHSHQWGLEITEIRQVAKALNGYIVIRTAIDENYDPSDDLKEAISRLIVVLKQSGQATFNATSELNVIVNWLEVNHQAPEVCQTIRRLTGKYNFYAQVSDNLILKFLNRPVDQTQQITEYIVGRPQTGRIRTVGEVSGKLNPDPDRINLSIILNAVASGNMSSQARNITVSSSTNNRLYAVKDIYFDGKQLASSPARSSVQISSTITGINSPGGLVQTTATNRVNELKPQADAEAAYKARIRVESSLNKEVGDMIVKANARFLQVTELYRARDIYPEPFDCSTTEHALKFSAYFSDGIPLIPHAVPEAPGKSDVFVAIHQSAIIESCKTMLADLKGNQRVFMTIAKIMLPDEAYKDFAKNAAKNNESNVSGGNIYFNAQYPVNIQFTNNTIVLDIRIDAFQGKDSSSPKEIPMNLSTAYKIDRIDKNGVWFVRIKDPELVPRDFETETRRLTTQETTLRNRLQKDLKDAFPDSFQIKPLKLDEITDKNNPDAVQLTGTLRPVSAKAANGWLTMNWLLME